MSDSEKQFKKWMLKKIDEILEETSQMSQGSCPFCCGEEYPVKEICGTWISIEVASPPYDDDEDEWTIDDVDAWHIDHYDDCFVTILEKQYKKIKEHGFWC